MDGITMSDGRRKTRPLEGAGSMLCVVVVLLLTGSLVMLAQSPAAWITKDQEEQIVRRVRDALPQGSTITRTELNRTPDDWYTFDDRGFEIDGKNAEHSFQIWFLPKDWLGIRQNKPNRMRTVYWEGS